tara:strand:+ start:848 stop:2632 length:1785 start_codon:yes stop_codon:yes gene_type:complete
MSDKFVAKSVIVFDEKRSNYTKGQEIRIKIPATSCPVVSARDTYLRFKVVLSHSDADVDARMPMILNSLVGGAGLIKTLSIYAMKDNTLLEQIDNYALLAYLQAYYGDSENDKNIKALTEGAVSNKEKLRNPFYEVITDTGAGNGHEIAGYKEVEICLPLKLSGLLSPKAYNRSLPVVALGGLEIRILLESDMNKVIQFATGKAGDGKYNDSLLYHEAFVDSEDVATNGNKSGQNGNNTAIANGAGMTPIILNNVNGADAGARSQRYDYNTGAFNNAVDHMGIPCDATGQRNINGGGLQFVNEYLPYFFNQRLRVGSTANASLNQSTGRISNFTIANGAGGASCVNLTCAGGGGAVNADTAGGCIVQGAVLIAVPSQTYDFTISEVQMVVGVLQTSPDYVSAVLNKSNSSQGVSMDIKSFNNYKVNQNAGVTKSSLYIPMNERRAYSILCVPEDLAKRPIYADGLRPPVETPLNYHFVISNLRVPNRNVELARIVEEDRATQSYGRNEPIHSKELEDALNNCGIAVENLDRSNFCFAIGRALSRYGHTFNAQDLAGEVRLNIEYTAQTKNLLWNNFVCCLKRITTSSAGVMVEQ